VSRSKRLYTLAYTHTHHDCLLSAVICSLIYTEYGHLGYLSVEFKGPIWPLVASFLRTSLPWSVFLLSDSPYRRLGCIDGCARAHEYALQNVYACVVRRRVGLIRACIAALHGITFLLGARALSFAGHGSAVETNSALSYPLL
jgi:hypothetical protein